MSRVASELLRFLGVTEKAPGAPSSFGTSSSHSKPVVPVADRHTQQAGGEPARPERAVKVCSELGASPAASIAMQPPGSAGMP